MDYSRALLPKLDTPVITEEVRSLMIAMVYKQLLRLREDWGRFNGFVLRLKLVIVDPWCDCKKWRKCENNVAFKHQTLLFEPLSYQIIIYYSSTR